METKKIRKIIWKNNKNLEEELAVAAVKNVVKKLLKKILY